MTNAIVCLHGWGYQPSIWQALAAEMPAYSVQMPELYCEAPHLDAWVERLAPRIPEQSLILGWSLGTMLALALAHRYPKKVRQLVLIGSTPKFVSSDTWAHGLSADVVTQFQNDFARQPLKTLKRFLALQVMGDADRLALQAILAEHLVTDPEKFPALQVGLDILAKSDLRPQLPCHSAPMLLLHGAHDALMPAASAEYLQALHPASRLIIESDAGHAPMLSQPAKLAALIQEVSLGSC